MSTRLPPAVEHLVSVVDAETSLSAQALRDAITNGHQKGIRPLRAILNAGVGFDVLERAAWQHRGYEFVSIRPELVDNEAIHSISLSLCKRIKALPFRQGDDGTVVVVFADPDNIEAADVMRKRYGTRMRVAVADARQIETALISMEHAEAFSATEDDDSPTGGGAPSALTAEVVDVQAEGKVAQMAAGIVQRALSQRASDIHLEPSGSELVVRYRIDGALQRITSFPVTDAQALVNRFKIIAGLDVGERRLPQDGRFSMQMETKVVDMRLATLPTVWGYEGAVIRILDRSDDIATLESLGLERSEFERFTRMLASPHGAIFATGPTGSGKTTTLYASLARVATPEVKVLTVEDPVEMRIPNITQVQVNKKTGLDFARALRSFLRCDPDIVLVGEIRDTETANVAIEAALTGHLVLATLHANRAPAAPARLLDMEVEPYLAASAMKGVISQRLVRRLCEHCRQELPMSEELANQHEWPGGNPPPVVFRPRPEGCSRCSGGYRGRLLLAEVLEITEDLSDMIVKHAPSYEIERAAAKDGFRSMYQIGLSKVVEGITSLDEVLRVVD